MEVFFIIIIAVFGFGILVFFHELGHFLTAKIFGVKVETFAIGWGPKIFGFKYKETTYQISAFPIGGFCQFKGDNVSAEDAPEACDPDSFYGTASWKRLLIAFAGPFMNFLIAVIMFSLMFLGSQDTQKIPNKLLLIDDVYEKFGLEYEHSPAYSGGLRSGDIVIAVNNKPIRYYEDLTRKMIYNGKKPLTMTVLRDETTDGSVKQVRKLLNISPQWDPSQMKAIVGVYYYLEPIVANAGENKLAQYMKLQNGDKILAVNGDNKVITDIYINQIIGNNFSRETEIVFKVQRGDEVFDTTLVCNEVNHHIDSKDCYLEFDIPQVHIPGKNIFAATWEGIKQSADVVAMSAIGLHSMIFMPKKNVSRQLGGPIRIGQMIGQATVSGFKTSVGSGIRNFFYVISVISLALGFFNLLPLPAVDGGHILLCLIEIVIRRKLKLKVLYYINLIGLGLLVLLSLVIAYIDISNLMHM